MLAAIGAAPAEARTPYPVGQIHATPAATLSSPQGFYSFDGAAVFIADDSGAPGALLWRSDGSAAGTYPLVTSGPGRVSSPLVYGSTASSLFFIDGEVVNTLFATGATPGTTVQLANPLTLVDPSGGPPSWSVPEQGLLYFNATDDIDGPQLWRSDGTPGGTFSLTHLGGRAPVLPDVLAYYAGAVFFGAADGDGPALWKSDGTPGGTRVVTRFPQAVPGVPGPDLLQKVGRWLVFAMSTPERGFELWRSDGTAAGTVPLRELVPGPGSPVFYTFVKLGVKLGHRLVFVADDGRGQDLWVTDGTNRGTRRLTHFALPAAFGVYFTIAEAITVGGSLFFAADDGVHGMELWVSDGTAAGTHMVADVCPGPCASQATPLGVLGSRLLFRASDGRHGIELWSSDGTAAGTRMVADICAGSCDSIPYVVAVLGARAVLVARDVAYGQDQLWATDGTPGGTERLTSFTDANLFSDGFQGITAAGLLLFQGADPAHGRTLWRSDGTAAGTYRIDL